MIDATDYKYDVQGWLEDCLGEMEMYEEYELVLSMCEQLLEKLEWPDFTGSDIRFRKIMCLLELNRNAEAVQYCKNWISDEPKNLLAAVAGVYALTQEKVYEEAEQLVDRFIMDPDDCDDDNYIMFVAASSLYEAMRKKDKKKQIDMAIQKYDEGLERESEFWEDDFDLDDISEEDLPF